MPATPLYVVMWSSGKDSYLALSRARKLGLSITTLVNFCDEPTGRVRFHAPAAPGIRGQGLRHVIKGGAFSTLQPNATAANRVPAADDRTQLWNTGFRCARGAR